MRILILLSLISLAFGSICVLPYHFELNGTEYTYNDLPICANDTVPGTRVKSALAFNLVRNVLTWNLPIRERQKAGLHANPWSVYEYLLLTNQTPSALFMLLLGSYPTPTPTATPSPVATPVPTVTPTPSATPMPTYTTTTSTWSDCGYRPATPDWGFWGYNYSWDVHTKNVSISDPERACSFRFGQSYPFHMTAYDLTMCGGWPRVFTGADPALSHAWQRINPAFGTDGPHGPGVYPTNSARECIKNVTRCAGTCIDYWMWREPGCTDGYLTEADCILNAGASACSKLPAYGATIITETSFSDTRWCPLDSSNYDPVACFSSENGPFSRECQENFIGGYGTNGSDTFCAQYGCDSARSCWCDFVMTGSQLEILYNSVWDEAFLFPIELVYQSEGLFPEITRVQRTILPDIYAYAQLEDQTLTLTFVNSNDRTIVLIKSPFVQKITASNSIVQYEIPDEVFLTSGLLEVNVFEDMTQTWYTEVPITAFRWCRARQGIADIFDNWDCLSWSQRAAVILVLLALLLMILAVCPGIPGAIVLWCVCMGRTPFACWNCISANPMLQDMGSGVTKIGRYFFGRRPSASTMAVFLLAIPLVFAQQHCDYVSYQTTNETLCVYDGNTQTCSINVNTQLVLNQVGSVACLTVGNTEGDTIAYLTFEYLNMQEKVLLEKAYYTSRWHGVTESKLRCNDKLIPFGAYCDDATCSGFSGSDRSYYGQLIDPAVIAMPGRTFCTPVCRSTISSIEDCNCPFSFPSCQIDGYGVIPSGDWGVVMQPFRSWKIPNVRVKIKTDMIDLEIVINPDNITNLESAGLYITFDGIFEGATTNFDRKVLISSTDQSAWLVNAADVDRPEPGIVGDIQASFASGLTNPSATSFSIAQGIVRDLNVRPGGSFFIFNQNGWDATLDKLSTVSLPGGYLGQQWYLEQTNETYLHSFVLRPAALSLHFVTANAIIVESVAFACPKITGIENVNGCADCSTGFTVDVWAFSECAVGLVKVTSDVGAVVVWDTAILLTENSNKTSIRLTSSVKYGNFKLCLVGKTKTDCRKVEFNLVEVETITPIPEEGPPVIVIGGNNDIFSDWSPIGWASDVFNGAGNWWKYILVFFGVLLIGAIALAICAAIGYFGFTYFMGWWASRKALSAATSYMIAKKTDSAPLTQRTSNRRTMASSEFDF